MRNRRAGKQPRRYSWPIGAAISLLPAIVAAAACLPRSGPPLNIHEDDAGGPAAIAGAADGRIRTAAAAQERTLAAGFFYDVFVVSPNGGATTGGTRIVLRGSGTHWTSASSVAVAGQPCSALSFTDATDLACT